MIAKPETTEEKVESARLVAELADNPGWLEISKMINNKVERCENYKGLDLYDKNRFYAEALGRVAKRKAYQDVLNIVNQQKSVYNEYIENKKKGN